MLLHSPAQQRLAASLLLFSPHLPLIFMGEEYGEERPFPFFCSFGDEQLIQSVREGRSREFAAFAWQGEVPDPRSPETYASARLTWSWPEGSKAFQLRRLYRDLLGPRQWPALRDYSSRSARLIPDPETGPLLHMVRGDSAAGVLAFILEPFGVACAAAAGCLRRSGEGATIQLRTHPIRRMSASLEFGDRAPGI